ncbi:mitogen-activated protein kinase kinase kinase 17-like protein [Tanacetum coccineum]
MPRPIKKWADNDPLLSHGQDHKARLITLSSHGHDASTRHGFLSLKESRIQRRATNDENQNLQRRWRLRPEIWEFGCIVFEMLTGKQLWLAYKDLGKNEVLRCVGYENEIELVISSSSVSNKGKIFLMGCLCKKTNAITSYSWFSDDDEASDDEGNDDEL